MEFYGRDEDRPWYVGVAYISSEFPDDLIPHKEAFTAHAFASDDVLDVATAEVVSIGQVHGDFFDLRGKTLFWCCRHEEGPDPLRFLQAIADSRRRTAPQPLEPPPQVIVCHILSAEDLSEIFLTKRVLVFTGAGISTASGFPDADGLSSSLGFDDTRPVDGFVRDVLTNPASLAERVERMHQVAPTRAHWVLKRLQDRLGFEVWTGNFDGLHEATGTKVRFMASTDEELDPEDLRRFDAVVAIGVSMFGFGRFATAYRKAHPDGRIIAIDTDIPGYLREKDGVVRGDVQEALSKLEQLVGPRHT
jgi:hypothetical protein